MGHHALTSTVGFAFAWQEMMLVMAMLLRYFDFEMDDPDYSLQIASTLTVKPKNLRMKARPRAERTAVAIERDILEASTSYVQARVRSPRRSPAANLLT